MLVVAANWGFTDGTLLAGGPPPRAARGWLRRVRQAAIRSGFGRDGVYRPPAEVDLVLAGDTFDCLVSAAWCGRQRPWHGGLRVAEARRRVLLGCARRAAPLLSGLARIARGGLVAPTADRRGRPSLVTATRVPVRLVLLVGDRDRPLAEAAAEAAARGAVVAPAWSDGVVLVRHGHEFDPACHVDGSSQAAGRPPTLAESMAVDLVGRFAVGLAAAGVPATPIAPLLDALASAAALEMPQMLSTWGTADTGPAAADPALRRGVESAWCRAVDGWLREARACSPDLGLPVSPLESLAAWLASRGAVPPPSALAALLQHGAARLDGGGDTARAVVLGHPEQSAADGAVICLGRRTVRRWSLTSVVSGDGAAAAACVAPAVGSRDPVTIAWSRRDERPEWLQIAGVTAADGPIAAGSAWCVDAA